MKSKPEESLVQILEETTTIQLKVGVSTLHITLPKFVVDSDNQNGTIFWFGSSVSHGTRRVLNICERGQKIMSKLHISVDQYNMYQRNVGSTG